VRFDQFAFVVVDRPSGYPVGTADEALDCVCGLYLNEATAWTQPLWN
jgi:hypothetical protein